MPRLATGDLMVLCFHGIGTPERELEPGEDRFWITPDVFDAMLSVVRRDPRYRITFDDGNASDVEHALPALARHGIPATFFVVAGRLGRRGSLGTADVSELRRAGMTIGTHGMKHRSWRCMSDAEVQEELVEARDRLADASGGPITQASCPFGFYDRRVVRALRACGYDRVYTVDGGPTHSRAWLRDRYMVRSSDDPTTLEELGQERLGRAATRVLKRTVKRWR